MREREEEAKIPSKPKVYCASKLYHAPMWRDWRTGTKQIELCSTWHDNLRVEQDDSDPQACRIGWERNVDDIVRADALLCYAHTGEKLNGGLVEIGMAIALYTPVYLVGGHTWGTWRYMQDVSLHESLAHAVAAIVKEYRP